MYVIAIAATVVAGYMLIEPVKIYWMQRRFRHIKSIDPKYKIVLEQSFPYYQALNDELKKTFERRVQFIISQKDFYAFSELVVTDEMMTLVAATATQLTFGFKQFWLPNVKAFLIYPTSFQRYNGMPKFKGEFTESGYIRMSWEHFRQGYLEPRDGVNLGLHEMAHALNNQHEIQFIGDELRDGFTLFNQLAALEIKRIRNHEEKFLRDYAGTNMYELFAVCTEYFFEEPELFKSELPELYSAMQRVMKQDPSNAEAPVIKNR